MLTYFPSCNYTKANPKSAIKIRAYLKEKMPVAGCCRIDKREFTPDDQALIVCQACREVLESKVNTMSLWEYLDQDDDFVFPNYQGKEVYLQDCWRDRDQPQVHEAVRHLLEKMNIQVHEMTYHKENAIYCGDLHLEIKNPTLLKEIDLYPNTKLSKLSEELKIKCLQDYFKDHQEYPIITYCNRCLKGVQMAGFEGAHLLDLLMNETDIFNEKG